MQPAPVQFGKFNHDKTARAFASWVAHARSRTGAKALVLKIVNRAVSSSFNTWVDETARRVQYRRILVRAHGMSTRVCRRVCRRAFFEWCKQCLRSNHVRRLMSNTLDRKAISTQRDCFVSWVQAVGLVQVESVYP